MGQAQQALQLVHQVVFVRVHFSIDIYDAPQGFNDFNFFFGRIVFVDQPGKLPPQISNGLNRQSCKDPGPEGPAL